MDQPLRLKYQAENCDTTGQWHDGIHGTFLADYYVIELEDLWKQST
jgi:hypothetical protein